MLNNTVKQIEIDENVNLFMETDRRHTIDDIIQPNSQIKFSHNSNVFGNDIGAIVWIKLDVISETDQNWFLKLEPSWLDRVELYRVDNQLNIVDRKVYDRAIPFAQQDLSYRTPLFQFNIPPQTSQTIYLKISNVSGVVRHMNILSFDEFIRQESSYEMIWGAVFGIYLFIIWGSIWFEKVTRNGIYASFAVYVFSCGLFNFILTGWWNQFVFPNVNLSDFHIMGVSGIWLIYTSIHFFFKYLYVEKFYPFTGRLFLKLLFYFTIIYTVVMLLGNQYQMIKLYMVALVYFIAPLSFIFMIWPIYKSQSEIKVIFSIAIMLYIGSFFYSSLTVLGYFKKTNFNLHINTLCEVLVFLVIYYSLSRKYQEMIAERNSSQYKLLEISRNTQSELIRQVKNKTQELIQAQNKLEISLEKERKAYHDQSNFVAMVSHELRTPLSVVDAAIQNLTRNKKILNPSVHKAFQHIKSSVKDLSLLIDNFLNNKKLDNFSERIESKWIALHTLFEDAISTGYSVNPLHHYYCDLKIPESVIWADERLLKLTLRALTENIAKDVASGADITFSAEKIATGWFILIQANSETVAASMSMKDQYFEKMEKIDDISVETGLGIVLSKQLTELQGGEIDFSLDKDASSCLVRIFLPLPKGS